MADKRLLRVTKIFWPTPKNNELLTLCEGDDKIPFFIVKYAFNGGLIKVRVPRRIFWSQDSPPTILEPVLAILSPVSFGLYEVLTEEEVKEE